MQLQKARRLLEAEELRFRRSLTNWFEEAAKKARLWYAQGRIPKCRIHVSQKNDVGDVEFTRISMLQRF